jgi:hypothetical protein
VAGWKELITTNPPVGGTGTLLVLPMFSGYVAALSASLLARRTKRIAISLVPIAVVLGLGIVTGTTVPVSIVVQGAVFGSVAVAWLALRNDRRRPRLEGQAAHRSRVLTGVGALLAAALLGWFVGPRLPMADASERTVWRVTVTPPFDPRQYPSPLSNYREYVKDVDVKDSTLFTIDGLPEDTLVRLATMDRYDGLVWRPSYQPDQPATRNSGYFERMGAQIESDFGGKVVTVTVTIGSYVGVWVPDIGEVLSLRFEGGPRDELLNEEFRYNRATDTAASRVPLQKGDRYVMTVRLPTKKSTFEKAVITADMSLVATAENVPELTKWANTPAIQVVLDPGTRIDQYVDRMKQDGAYSDGDQDQGQAPARAGHSAYRLGTEFVGASALVGNAEQYASALALVLRGVDALPSRVVMGFQVTGTGKGPVEVTGKQVDAWVEVPIDKVGWVAILPTPDRSDTALKQKSPSPPQPEYDTQVPPPPPVLEPEFDQPAQSKTGAKPTKPDGPKAPAKPNSGDGDVVAVSRGVVIVGGVLGTLGLISALLVLGIVLAKGLRRRKRKKVGTTHERIANGWREVTDAAIDMGRPLPTTATRREAALFLDGSTVTLAERADAAVFGPDQPTDADVEQYWVDMEAMLASIHGELGLRARLNARLSLSSFRQGWRRSADGADRRTERSR